MASFSSSSLSSVDHRLGDSQSPHTTRKEIRSHEIAIAELSKMSSSRGVYQRNGNLFFRTTTQKATASEQKQLEIAQRKLKQFD